MAMLPNPSSPSQRPDLADQTAFRLLAWLPVVLMGVHIGMIQTGSYGIEPASQETIGVGLVIAGALLNMLVFRRYRRRNDPIAEGGVPPGIGQRRHFLERFVHVIVLLGLFVVQSQLLQLPVGPPL